MHTKHHPAQRCPASSKRIFLFVLALVVLTNCSQIFTVDVPNSRTETDYRQLIVTYFRKEFKDYQSYGWFEISAPRVVDSIVGRTSLTCLRFDAKGRRRVYAFFIRNNAIVTARYDVQTDNCATQSYEPFKLITGSEGPATAPPQNPIY